MIGLKPITYYTLIGSSTTLSTLRDTLLNSFLVYYTTLLLGLPLVFLFIVDRFYLFFKALYYIILLHIPFHIGYIYRKVILDYRISREGRELR